MLLLDSLVEKPYFYTQNSALQPLQKAITHMNLFMILHEQQFFDDEDATTELFIEEVKRLFSEYDSGLAELVIDPPYYFGEDLQDDWNAFYEAGTISFERYFLPSLLSILFDSFLYEYENEEILEYHGAELYTDLLDELYYEWDDFVYDIEDDRYDIY